MDLSFWCWYDIKQWDYAFLEVSKDGRYYDLIDSFSGSSSGWMYKSYRLTSYEDESIFIRFRYITDAINSGEGFYIDDVAMYSADLLSISTISNSITNNQYNITGKSPGVYLYSVRGSNPARGWGDFSTLERIYVGTRPPNTPAIDGLARGKTGTEYDYTFSSTDPEGHNLFYFITWGDGTTEQWVGPYPSGQSATIGHTWTTKGTYSIKTVARDIYGAESDWATLEVTMPLSNNVINHPFLDWLFERFPNAFPVLRYFFGY
jgi:hypothetical protein